MEMTNYFRKALAVQMSPRLEMNSSQWIDEELDDIAKGHIEASKAEILFKDQKLQKQDDPLAVLIAVKLIKPAITDTVKMSTGIEDMTGFFYLPALLLQSGKLLPHKEKTPWFVREFLSPMVEPEICVGEDSAVDAYLQETIGERMQIDSWDKNWEYACRMYRYVTQADIYEETLGKNKDIIVDGGCYLFVDKTVNTSFHVIKLYDAIGNSKTEIDLPLYRCFIGEYSRDSMQAFSDSAVCMQKHAGQMGGRYPLSKSQREAINHVSALRDGEIQAVSGPPGTGKTTLLQSVVADMITKRALAGEAAPIIVAASTNNQAVTNIIDSFGSIQLQGIRNLEKRWITVADSFAVYFPSKQKESEAKDKGYQTRDELIFSMNDQEEINTSKDKMLKACSNYFSVSLEDVWQCQNMLHRELKTINGLRIQLLEQFETLMEQTHRKKADQFLEGISHQKNILEQQTNQISEHILEYQKEKKSYQDRVSEWKRQYRKLPWYVRLFSFLPGYKEHILRWVQKEKTDAELLEFEAAATLKMVLCKYTAKVNETDDKIYTLRCNLAKVQQRYENLCEEEQKVGEQLNKCIQLVEEMEKHTVNIAAKRGKMTNRELLEMQDMVELNELLDVSARHVEFWLAVHYYECKWLTEKPLSKNQIGKNYENVVRDDLKKLAMLTPCMVMTFYMLPKYFQVYNANEKIKNYLFNHIDLLIVDEAGQTSPEVAAASFALAKRALVVGDEQQIPPVWGVREALDIALAMECGVIGSDDEFARLKANGRNVSSSSVMKIASLSSSYSKEGPGLFLCEHRRCYDEIIEYCNALVYDNRLQPMRGRAEADRKRPSIMSRYPVMGYYAIHTERSSKDGTSRVNQQEAEQIAIWLKENYDSLCEGYVSGENPISKKEVLAIITPFKKQAARIRKELERTLGIQSKNIDVGTVHTFQGAERRVIIFSSTYGSKDGCYFIDRQKNLMNVAVSRAKDAFWVFGSIGCLGGKNEKAASGLLYSYVKDHAINS